MDIELTCRKANITNDNNIITGILANPAYQGVLNVLQNYNNCSGDDEGQSKSLWSTFDTVEKIATVVTTGPVSALVLGIIKKSQGTDIVFIIKMDKKPLEN